jgi:hypothetical protein
MAANSTSFKNGNTAQKNRKRAGPQPRHERFAGTFKRTDQFLDTNVDGYLKAMHDIGMGDVWVGVQTKEGVQVYRKPPDRQALQYLLDRHLHKPNTLEDAILGTARTIATQKQVGLIEAQTQAQLAQVSYTNEQTRAFQLATITPELVERVLISLAQSPVTLLQALTPEEWMRLAESQSARQAFLSRFADRVKRAGDEALLEVYADVIPASFEPERDDDDGS